MNKMCLAADVPLIESGTTGFQGQVQPIVKVIQILNGWKLMGRGSQSVMIVMRRRFLNRFRCVLFAQRPHNQFIVSCGLNHISSLNYSVSMKMKSPK